jgi:hypothetical protein
MNQTQEIKPTFELTLENLMTPVEPEAFEEALLVAVDFALQGLGDSGQHAFYQGLMEKYDVSREEIPSKFAMFAVALENVFGDAAILLEMRIMQRLHGNFPELEFPLDPAVFSLITYVETVRNNL